MFQLSNCGVCVYLMFGALRANGCVKAFILGLRFTEISFSHPAKIAGDSKHAKATGKYMFNLN